MSNRSSIGGQRSPQDLDRNASSQPKELGGQGMPLLAGLSSPGEVRGLETNVRSESLWKSLLTLSEEWLRVSRKPSPRLMVPLSFLINTWPWARLPSLCFVMRDPLFMTWE